MATVTKQEVRDAQAALDSNINWLNDLSKHFASHGHANVVIDPPNMHLLTTSLTSVSEQLSKMLEGQNGTPSAAPPAHPAASEPAEGG